MKKRNNNLTTGVTVPIVADEATKVSVMDDSFSFHPKYNMIMPGGGSSRSLSLPHIQTGPYTSMLDILMFFERVNNSSKLSILHNTRSLRARTSSSIAVSVLTDSALTVINPESVRATQVTVGTEIYDYHTLADNLTTIVASKTQMAGARGYNVVEVLEFFEYALTGSANAVGTTKARKELKRVSGADLANNLRKLLSGDKDCTILCTGGLDTETLDLLSSLMHHYYMVYNAFVHTNAFIYLVSRDAPLAERKALVSKSSSGLCSQSALLDVMGILPSTILSDVHNIIHGVKTSRSIRLNHVHDIARLSSYIALLHTYKAN